MSNKKQPYINKAPPIEPGAHPPRYQPPPQVTTAGILKHYPSQLASKDVQPFGHLVDPKSFQPDLEQFFPKPETAKPHYPTPPQYSSPPSVLPQRRPNPIVSIPPPDNVDMLKFVRKAETEQRAAAVSADQTQAATRDVARRMQTYANEIRALKEANQRLGDDNQELRDLCCFLDDDRQKGRKLAREWQRFGRYTASVMRQEVSAYQNKLRELDNKQQELIKDNLELKELCLYLDEERNAGSICPSCGGNTGNGGPGIRPGQRDDGDGSSSSTNADEPPLPSSHFVPGNGHTRRSESRERLLEETMIRQRTGFNDQMMQYVRTLERRVKQLEEEKHALEQKIGQSIIPSENSSWDNDNLGNSRPEAVVQALQVWEVREQLERSGSNVQDLGMPESLAASSAELDMVSSDMDDGEKALVREMCNVVWRKLEEGPSQRR